MLLLNLERHETVGSCRATTVGGSRTGKRRINEVCGLGDLTAQAALIIGGWMD